MGHHKLAASASHRWINCPGSVRLIDHLIAQGKIKPSTSNPAADRGTAVHYVIEQCLLNKVRPSSFRGKTLKLEGMSSSVKLNGHDIKCARMCIKFAHQLKRRYPGSKLFPERKYDLTNVYGAPLGGTADITVITRDSRLIISDYKNGKILVDVVGNYQLRVYALGAYYAFRDKYEFDTVELNIIQPNSFHNDGPIRKEEFSLEELLNWEREKLVPALELIRIGRDDLVPDEDNQCKWCDAKAHCKARKANKPILVKDIIREALPVDSLGKLPFPEELSDRQLSDVLQNADRVIKFYTDCKKHAHDRLEQDPTCMPDWQLVPRLGNRKLVDPKDLQRKLRRRKLKLSDITVTEERIMSVTEIEKFLAKDLDWEKDDVVALMEEITDRPTSGYSVAKVESAEDEFAEFATKSTDTKKPATRSKKYGK